MSPAVNASAAASIASSVTSAVPAQGHFSSPQVDLQQAADSATLFSVQHISHLVTSTLGLQGSSKGDLGSRPPVGRAPKLGGVPYPTNGNPLLAVASWREVVLSRLLRCVIVSPSNLIK